MTRQLYYAVVVDGGTDRALLPIVRWAIHQVDPEVEILEAEFRKRTGSVSEFMSAFESGAMLVFVHRDSENMTYNDRYREFEDLQRNDVIPVITVRMTEAWLLVDAQAIAAAAGRPSAQVALPAINRLEGLADPKTTLEALLLDAAGNPSGREGKKFKASLVSRRVDVAERIGDFSALRGLPAFQRFEAALRERYPYPIS